MPDPVTRAVQILNEALERDPDAITELINLRVDCNAKLAAHPTVQAGVYDGRERIGVLGLINGVLATTATGVIGAKGPQAASGGGFLRVERFVDLRSGKTDFLA